MSAFIRFAQLAPCQVRTALPASWGCAGKASKEAGSSSGPESQFIRGVIALHDKYIEYVQVGWLSFFA